MVQLSTLRLASKRVPLIRFRKGGLTSSPPSPQTAGAPQAAGAPSSTSMASSQTAPKQAGSAIADYDLPQRYWRKPIDAVEMEYINRGGPA